MMAKRMKRTLALALSLVMVLGLLPAAAFAARVEDEYDSTAQIEKQSGDAVSTRTKTVRLSKVRTLPTRGV